MTPVPGCRFGDACALETFEDAVDCLGSHSALTRTEIAHRVAVRHPERSEAYLRSCLSPNDGTHNIQLAIAPAFTQASGNPALLAWHARACGYGIYQLPVPNANRSELLGAFLDSDIAHGDLARALRGAHADRKLTAAERGDITLRAQTTITELVELIAAVNLEADPPR
jgi:hypothetical protein